MSHEPIDESKHAKSELSAASAAQASSSPEAAKSSDAALKASSDSASGASNASAPQTIAQPAEVKPAGDAVDESSNPFTPLPPLPTEPPAALPSAGAAEARRSSEPSAWGRAFRAAKKFVLTTGVLDDLGASIEASKAASGGNGSASTGSAPPPSAAAPASEAPATPANDALRKIVEELASRAAKGTNGPHCVLPPACATRPVPPDTAVVGHTSAVAVPEILGFLSSLQKSGTFWVWNEKESYSIRLVRGQVVSAQSDHQVPGLLLGHILVMQEAIGEEELVRFLEMRPEASARIGDALRNADLITAKALRDAITYQAQRVFNRAYEIGEGWFRFEPTPPEDQPEQTLSVTHLLLESARTRDETEERLEGVLGDPFAE